MSPRLVLAAAAAMVVIAVAPAATAGGPARVWIADDQPLVVRGTGFHDAAKVTVLVTKLKQTFRMSTVSGTTGSFTARSRSGLPTHCGTTIVTATDENGRRAISRIVANDCGIRIPPPGP